MHMYCFKYVWMACSYNMDNPWLWLLNATCWFFEIKIYIFGLYLLGKQLSWDLKNQIINTILKNFNATYNCLKWKNIVQLKMS
jgi:hypothetical protein